jgi:hypothetical protein
VNTQNEGVKRATELVSYENSSPEEWEDAKFEASRRRVIKLEREDAKFDVVRNAILKGMDDQLIADITEPTIEQVKEIRADLEEN